MEAALLPSGGALDADSAGGRGRDQSTEKMAAPCAFATVHTRLQVICNEVLWVLLQWILEIAGFCLVRNPRPFQRRGLPFP
jgi:hypothetical protein